MPRPPLRSLVRLGVALVIVTSAVGVVQAASLGGISSDRLDAWTFPAAIVTADVTPPTISASVVPVANPAGWHNTTATVTFVCADAQSGIGSCTGPVTVSGEGAGQVVVGDATDVAGNSASTSVAVNVDVTPPQVQIVGVADGAVLDTAPNPTCTASDVLSGLAGDCVVTVTAGADGSFTVTASATDLAGNLGVATAVYTLAAICGTGSPDVPCVVPFGTVIEDKIDWNADVLVLGEVTKKIEVTNGSVTVGSTGVVGGHIKQEGDGGITVLAGGFVDGKVEESGDGSVAIDGTVDGNVSEEGAGDLVLGPAAYIDGSVKESGPGSVSVSGTVEKDIEERDDGDLTIAGSGTVVDGNVRERGAGSLFVEGMVRKNVEESDDGDLTVVSGAAIGGDVTEDEAGSLIIGGPSSIGGQAKESDAGDMLVGAGAVIGSHADSSGVGVCSISPAATVDGRRRNDCAI